MSNLRRLLNMSLYTLYHDPFFVRPSRFFNQPLSLSWDQEFFKPLAYPRIFQQAESQLSRPWVSSETIEDESSVQVTFEKDQFKANVNVKDFQPEEITVKVAKDNTLVIEGKHEQKTDEHNFVSRKFVRRYVLPENYDINKIESQLSSDGVLTIVAPSVNDGNNLEYKTIPIQQTGEPANKIEDKK